MPLPWATIRRRRDASANLQEEADICFATAALIAGVAGSAVSAGGQLVGGAAAQNAANYRAQVASNNAQIAEQNADYAIAAGQQKASTESLKGAAIGGKIKAAQAASGVDVNTGSPVAVQESQREGAKLDAETVLANAEMQAYGYRSQATSFKAESVLDKAGGDAAMTGAMIGATGSLLSSASGLGFKWSKAGGMGATGSDDTFTGVGSSPY